MALTVNVSIGSPNQAVAEAALAAIIDALAVEPNRVASVRLNAIAWHPSMYRIDANWRIDEETEQ